MISIDQITPVTVTRGDVSLAECDFQQFPVVVWDNSKRADVGVFGRYLAALSVTTPYVYTQDDDCRVSPEGWRQMMREYVPGEVLVNMPPEYLENYKDTPEKLVGFGAIFPRDLVWPTFQRYADLFAMDSLFMMECDRVFTGLNAHRTRVIDVGIHHLVWAEGEGRMYHRPEHNRDRVMIRSRVLRVLGSEKLGPDPVTARP